MQNEAFEKAIKQVLAFDETYPRKAYIFISEILQETLRMKEEASHGRPLKTRHLTGAELAMGMREILLEQYGPFAIHILDEMNIHQTDDIGQIVYNLIKVKAFHKSETDAIDDFNHLYDFEETFVKPFDPKNA